MYNRTHVTLNISSGSVRLLYVKGSRIKKWESAPLPPGLVRDGLILKPKVLGAVISNLFRSSGVPGERVITSITGLSFIHRIMSMPRMKVDSEYEAIQRAADKEIPLPVEELYLSWQAIDGGQDEMNFFVLGVPRHPVDVLVQTLQEAGIRPYMIDLNPLALARAANRENAIIVALEPDCFDIVMVADGMPVIMHAMTPRGERASLEDDIRRLIDELSKAVEFYNSDHPRDRLSPDTPLLLTGELATDTTSELISAETGYPLESLVPPLSFPHDFPAAAFTVNIGLALKKLPLKSAATGGQAQFRDINLNILAAKYEPSTYRIKLPHIILSLVVIIGLGLLFPMNHFRSQAGAEIDCLQTKLTAINQQLEQVQLSASEAVEIENTIDKILADAETARQEYQYLISEDGACANNLRLVTNAFPAKAFFTSVTIDANQINVSGEADNSFTIIDYVTALEALDKFSEVRIVRIDDKLPAGDGTTGLASGVVTFKLVISRS
jgi:Tfp pilus assembly PilM family ATPase/Tfp pilus assembly protein PilN